MAPGRSGNEFDDIVNLDNGDNDTMNVHRMFGLLVVCGQIGCGLFVTDVSSEAQKASTTTMSTTTSTETETGTSSSTSGSTTSSSTSTSTDTETETVTETTTTTDTDAGAPQPDAEADAGSTPDAEAPDAGCVRELTIESVTHTVATVAAGTKDFPVLTMKLTAPACSDIEIKKADFGLVAEDFAPSDAEAFCAQPCATPADWNFANVKLNAYGATLMGPVGFKPYAANALAHASLADSFTMAAGSSLEVTITVDLSAPLKTNINGKRFQLFLSDISSTADFRTHINHVDPNAAFTVTDGQEGADPLPTNCAGAWTTIDVPQGNGGNFMGGVGNYAYGQWVDPITNKPQGLIVEINEDTHQAVALPTPQNLDITEYRGLIQNPDGSLLALGAINFDTTVLLAGPNPWKVVDQFDGRSINMCSSDDGVFLAYLPKGAAESLIWSTVVKHISAVNPFEVSIKGLEGRFISCIGDHALVGGISGYGSSSVYEISNSNVSELSLDPKPWFVHDAISIGPSKYLITGSIWDKGEKQIRMTVDNGVLTDTQVYDDKIEMLQDMQHLETTIMGIGTMSAPTPNSPPIGFIAFGIETDNPTIHSFDGQMMIGHGAWRRNRAFFAVGQDNQLRGTILMCTVP